MRWIIPGFLLLLGFFAMLSFNKNGEILTVMQGEVQKCEMLSGNNPDSIVHATIRVENGSYIISSLSRCKPGEKTRVLIKRGALYFNTVYAAESE